MKKILIILLLLCSLFTLAQPTKDCPPRSVCANYANVKVNGLGIQQINATNQGCLSMEHNSDWITITIASSGTLNFIITPNVAGDDFDFAVWGPNPSCSPTTTPIRCSWAAYFGAFVQPTGVSTAFNGGQNDLSEGAAGNHWVDDMNVLAGESYLIMVDDFNNNKKYSMTFGGTATLTCAPLPIELTSFNCESKLDNITISWSTASETNNQEFQLWRSSDAVNYTKVLTKPGAGTTSTPHAYWFSDYFPPTGTYYYKLIQKDYNGVETPFDITSCSYVQNADVKIQYFNLLGQTLDIDTAVPGLYIKEFSKNGNVRREVYYKK